MIRVVIEHHAKDTKDAELLIEAIRELRNEAMKQPGYLTGETLVSTEDNRNVMVISTWRSVKDWSAWDKSKLRTNITQKVHPLLSEPFTVRPYRYHLVRDRRVWSTL